MAFFFFCSAGFLTPGCDHEERQSKTLVDTDARAREPAATIIGRIPAPEGDSQIDQELKRTRERALRSPNEAPAWVALGEALAQKIRETAHREYYPHAEIAFQRALQIEPKNVSALNGLAWVFGARRELDQSVAFAGKALAFEPGSAIACGIIGDAELERGNYDEARKSYQKMMDLRPDLSSFSRAAYLLWVMGNKTKAFWLMEKAIAADAPSAEESARCRAKFAMILLQDGAILPAERTLDPALAAAPRNPFVLLSAARFKTDRKDYAAAAKFYEQAVAAQKSIEALAALGDLSALRGDGPMAEEYYRKVEALHAGDSAGDAHNDDLQMARFYADHDRKLDQALRLTQPHRETHNVFEADTLAWVYFKNGDLPRAAEAMQRALRLGTPDPVFHFHAGMIAAKSGDRASARQHLALALSMNPEFDPLYAPIALQTLADFGGENRSAEVPTSTPVAGH